MSAADDRAKKEALIRRISALMAKTTGAGCTEAEALAAAEMVSKMMAEHDLALSDIKLKDHANIVKDSVSTNGASLDQPAIQCANSVAYFTDTRCWTMRERGKATLVYFLGFDTDVIVAQYIYTIIDRAITYTTIRWKYAYEGWDAMAKSEKGHLQRSFELGMVDRINERLHQMKDERRKEAASTGRDLVVLKGALVDEHYAKLFKELGLKTRTRKAVSFDHDAYLAGQREGSNVSFYDGVSQSAEAAKIR